MSTVEQEVPTLEAGQRLTRAEFLRRWEAMPRLKRAELLAGVVHMPSPTSFFHGNAHSTINGWLWMYSLATTGTSAGVETTWLMAGDETPQPDAHLLILPEWGGQSRIEGRLRSGAPELLVEISLSRVGHDLGLKRDIYQASGVQEYLVVLAEDEEIVWHRLRQGRYETLVPDVDGFFKSEVFPGLWLDAAALFANDNGRILQFLQQGLASPEHAAFVAQLATRRPS